MRDEDWKGWWGDDPPFHVPVFVLTHHPREPVAMEGGTRFHFVTDGFEAALERAGAAAGEKDVSIGGGAATVRQYLRAGLVDEMAIPVAPVLLGDGERLFEGLDGYSSGSLRTSGSGSSDVLLESWYGGPCATRRRPIHRCPNGTGRHRTRRSGGTSDIALRPSRSSPTCGSRAGRAIGVSQLGV